MSIFKRARRVTEKGARKKQRRTFNRALRRNRKQYRDVVRRDVT